MEARNSTPCQNTSQSPRILNELPLRSAQRFGGNGAGLPQLVETTEREQLTCFRLGLDDLSSLHRALGGETNPKMFQRAPPGK